MRRSDMFALRISSSERQMIKALATRLQRSQSDAVRLVIREAGNALDPGNPVETSKVAMRCRTTSRAGEKDVPRQAPHGHHEAQLCNERMDDRICTSAQNEGTDESRSDYNGS
jgi:hypothetical protein